MGCLRQPEQVSSAGSLHLLSIPTFRLETFFLETPCPRWGYVQEVELLDLRLHRRIFCPACKSSIQLIDADARHTALERVDQAMRQMFDSFRNVGGSA